MTAKDMKTIQPLIHSGGVTRGVSESLTSDPDISDLIKKRLPKPQKSISLEYLLANGLPFFNAKSEKEVISSVCDFIKPLTETETGEHTFPVTLAGWENKYSRKFFSLPGVIKALVKAQSVTRLLIKSAIFPGMVKDVQTVDFLQYMEPLEAVYNRFFSKGGRIIPDYKLGAKGWREATQNQGNFNCVWEKALPSILVCFTIAAIRDGAYRVVEKGINSETSYLKASATEYLGMCPRCGTIFQKAMRNQLYDRDTCKVVVSKTRMV